MNLRDIRNKIRDILKEPDSTGFYNNEEINDWINEGQRELVKKTRILKGKSYLHTAEGVKEYELPEDYLDMVFLKYEDEKLRSISFDRALDENLNKKYYYTWDNVLNLTFDPGDNKIFLYYYKLPVDMEEDTDTPSIPLEHQDALVDYGLYKAKQTDRMFEESEVFKRDFKEKIQDIIYYNKEPATKQIKVKRL